MWQTAINPVVAMELLAEGTWSGAGVLGPEAFDAVPFLDLLAELGAPARRRASATRERPHPALAFAPVHGRGSHDEGRALGAALGAADLRRARRGAAAAAVAGACATASASRSSTSRRRSRRPCTSSTGLDTDRDGARDRDPRSASAARARRRTAATRCRSSSSTARTAATSAMPPTTPWTSTTCRRSGGQPAAAARTTGGGARCGRGPRRTCPSSLDDYYVPRGYAVVLGESIGTFNSRRLPRRRRPTPRRSAPRP